MEGKSGLLKLHAAVALFGLAGVIGKYVSWPAPAVTFGRVIFSSIFLLIFMLIKKEKLRLECRKDYVIIIMAGAVMAVHWTSFIHSIQISSVAIGTITFASFPLFVTFLEPVIFREKLKVSDLAAALVMIAGVAVTVPEFSLENTVTEGVIWGMISSFTYAVLSLMNRHFAGKYSGRKVCLYEQGTAAAVLLPFLFMFRPVSCNLSETAAVIFMGIFCTAIAHSMFISSLNKVKVQTAGIISGMETVYSIVFAVILLGDMITLRELAGGAVILAAAAYKTIKN
ncbi:MAG: DMT family transporter [Bacillota bacterium]|nr:DMT family transporter [Bacillota bacterium]